MSAWCWTRSGNEIEIEASAPPPDHDYSAAGATTRGRVDVAGFVLNIHSYLRSHRNKGHSDFNSVNYRLSLV